MKRFQIDTTFRPIAVATLAVAALGCGYDSPSSYPPPASVEGLWTAAAANPTILRLSPAQLLTSGSISPATAIHTPNATLADLDAVAFDTDGTMWVASADDSTLLAFAPASLNGSGTRQAKIVIRANAGSLSEPSGVVFDSEQRLWVANAGNGSIVRFDRAQIASSGAPIPGVIISTGGHPAGLAFDAAGSLWVANTSLNQVSGYTPVQLNTSGLLVPAQVVINANGISLRNPTGIAFDASGDLWVANLSTSTVVGFSPAQLTTTGSPAPKVVLSSSGGSLVGPSGLAFDTDGSLWVMGSQGDLYKFPGSALGATSAPSPSVSLHLSNYTVLWDLAFWPKPPGLPIN